MSCSSRRGGRSSDAVSGLCAAGHFMVYGSFSGRCEIRNSHLHSDDRRTLHAKRRAALAAGLDPLLDLNLG